MCCVKHDFTSIPIVSNIQWHSQEERNNIRRRIVRVVVGTGHVGGHQLELSYEILGVG